MTFLPANLIQRYVRREICVCTSDGISAASRLRSVRRALPRRPKRKTVSVPGSISRDGVRTTFRSRIFARHRDLSFRTPLKTLPPRLPRHRRKNNPVPVKRKTRLAHISGLGATPPDFYHPLPLNFLTPYAKPYFGLLSHFCHTKRRDFNQKDEDGFR